MKKSDKLEAIEKIITEWAEWFPEKKDVDRGTLAAILAICSIEEDDENDE